MEVSLIEAYRLYMAGTPIAIDMDHDGRYQRIGAMAISGGYVIVNNEYRRLASDMHQIRVGRS